MRRKKMFILVYCVLALIFALLSVWLIAYCYDSSAAFRSLFEGDGGAALGVVAQGSGFTSQTQALGRLSLYLFAAVNVLQCLVFFLGMTVLSFINRSADSIDVKLARLHNADIFLDLPLYVGLFGTVASFIVMNFNPQTSRLIAYSSTLFGIIISVFLRTTMLFPIKQHLVTEKAKLCGE
ncbi:MAG: hypothetical protein PHH77_07660 [Victivallaceae bacterium]|nr:hypothetical protein [Victivallaceae bacterium]